MADKKLNLKEIIEMAIQIETAGAAFYRRLRELAGSEGAKELFGNLEKAEHQHIKDFEAVLARASSRPGRLEYASTEEDLLYLRAFASRRIFTGPEDAARKAENLADVLEAINMALDFELSSAGFYREMGGMIEDPEDRASVQELEKQEKGHAAYLYKMREKISGKKQ